MGKHLTAAKAMVTDIDKDLVGLERELWAKRITLDQQLKFGEEGVNALYMLIRDIEKKEGTNLKSDKDFPKKKLAEYKNPNVKKFIKEINNCCASATKAANDYWNFHNSFASDLLNRIGKLEQTIATIISAKEAKIFPSKSLQGLKDAQKTTTKLKGSLQSSLAIGAPKAGGKAFKYLTVKDSMTVAELEGIASGNLKKELDKHDAKPLETSLKKVRQQNLANAVKLMAELAKEKDGP